MSYLLFATTNGEKFDLVASVFRGLGHSIDWDGANVGPSEEYGDISARAVSKAQQAHRRGIPDHYDGVLGVDDGLRLGDAAASADSKALTDAILAGDACRVGEDVCIVRAHALRLRGDHDTFRISIAEIPFVYLGNPKHVRRSPGGGLPLLQVLAPPGHTVPIYFLGREAVIRHFATHSEAAIHRLFFD
jgi:hypothetical protein